MQLKFVESFYWAATLNSVSLAAQRLFVTQSALSARIAALEVEMGASLLDRRDKRVRLTAAGLSFYTYAQKLLELKAQALEDVGASLRNSASLRIGVLESGIHSWLMPMLSALKTNNTDLALELTVESSQLLNEQLKRGALDIVFASVACNEEGIICKQYGQMPLVFVGDRQIYRKKAYSLDLLTEEELITFQRGSHPHNALMALLREHQLIPRRIHAVSSISAMVPMMQNGLGIATLPRKVAQKFATTEGLRLLPIEKCPEPLSIFASYREAPPGESKSIHSAIQQLLVALKQALSVDLK